jgi:hypothetical protein
LTNPFANDHDAIGCEPLISLLKNKPQSVWLGLFHHMNWDCCEYAIYWMVTQPECCKELAASVFGYSCPSNLYYGDYKDGDWEERGNLIPLKIIEKWSDGKYHQEDLQFNFDYFKIEVDGFIRDREKNGKSYPKLEIPEDLLNFKPGNKPIDLPKELDPRINPEIWDLFHSLGTNVGSRPA